MYLPIPYLGTYLDHVPASGHNLQERNDEMIYDQYYYHYYRSSDSSSGKLARILLNPGPDRRRSQR